MSSEASRERVVKVMEDNLRRDRTRATIQSFSNLGLLEFTRKRVGKDLGAQLRGTCPTCIGLGSVMSPQSVAIETFRRIRGEAAGGAPGDVVVHVAPTVAMQMEFWYEEECKELARSIAHAIHVRVDPMIHPEKARIEFVTKEKPHALRVGDEHDVDLLPGRLPSASSAAAVVDGRIAEVENAINNAGNFARIRIIDVDDEDDYVLAELVTAGVKSRRKRHGRREKLTAAEQTRQLRELAEDAARQSASRPPIGISPVSEEEEAQDKALSAERKGEAQPDAIIIAEGAVQHGEGDGRRKRRRRRRGRSGKERAEETVINVAAYRPRRKPPRWPATAPVSNGAGGAAAAAAAAAASVPERCPTGTFSRSGRTARPIRPASPRRRSLRGPSLPAVRRRPPSSRRHRAYRHRRKRRSGPSRLVAVASRAAKRPANWRARRVRSRFQLPSPSDGGRARPRRRQTRRSGRGEAQAYARVAHRDSTGGRRNEKAGAQTRDGFPEEIELTLRR